MMISIIPLGLKLRRSACMISPSLFISVSCSSFFNGIFILSGIGSPCHNNVGRNQKKRMLPAWDARVILEKLNIYEIYDLLFLTMPDVMYILLATDDGSVNVFIWEIKFNSSEGLVSSLSQMTRLSPMRNRTVKMYFTMNRTMKRAAVSGFCRKGSSLEFVLLAGVCGVGGCLSNRLDKMTKYCWIKLNHYRDKIMAMMISFQYKVQCSLMISSKIEYIRKALITCGSPIAQSHICRCQEGDEE